MKKSIVILVMVLVVAVGGIFYFLRQQQPVRQDEYATFLPPDTLAVTSIRDLNGLVDRFPATPLGRFLAKENVDAILREMKAGPEAIEEYNTTHDRIFSVLNNPGFRMVFGDDVELALLPFSATELDRNPEETLLGSVVILATTASASTMKTVAENMLHGQVEAVEDQGVSMIRIHLDDTTTAYVSNRDNRLLIGFTPGTLHRCLAARESGHHLAAGKNFTEAQVFWQQGGRGKVHFRQFMQLDALRKIMAQLQDRTVQEAARYLRGMHFAAGQAALSGHDWQSRSVSSYVYEELDPSVRELVDAGNGKNITLHLLKTNPLFYSWSVGFDAASWLQKLQETEPDQYRKWNLSMQKKLGVSLQQAASSFGPQYGFALEKIGQGGMFPLPRFVAFMQVHDRAVASDLLAGMRGEMARRGVAGYHEEKVDPYTLYSWTLLPGEATRPSYVLGADLLYLANNPDDIKELLRVENERERLPAGAMKRLGSFGDQVQQANNGVFLFWPYRFAIQIQTAADWLAGMITASRGISIDRLENEILALLRSTRLVVCTASLYPDHGSAKVVFMAREEKKKGDT
jgi:L-rhamnose mutarotase/preprotein translocase subunit YajC